MARILLGWELGSGLGHVATLLTVARELARRGHRPTFALRNVSEPWPLLAPSGYPVFQAPWLRDRPHLTGGQPFRSRSYADILAYNGFDDPQVLESLVSAWDRLLEAIDPDLVIVEHAPTLRLACFGRYPTIGIGTGFTVPHLDGQHFPVLNPEANELVPAARIASAIREVLGGRGIAAPPPALSATICEDSIPLCVDLLDPYRASRMRPAPGPLAPPASTATRPESSRDCLVYLPADHPTLDSLVRGLRDARTEGIAYIRNATESVLDALRSTRLAISTVPLNLDAWLPRVGAVLHHGGSGVAHRCLAAGIPQVLAPVYFEQVLTCSALQDLGVAIRSGGEQSGQALQRILEEPGFAKRARAQAEDVRRRYPEGSLARVLAACEDRIAPHSFRAAASPARGEVHIVHSFENANGGSEQRAVHLYELLRGEGPVALWCEARPQPELAARYPIRRIGPDGFPSGGTLVFVSTYYGVGAWLEHVRPQRIVVIYNVDAPATRARWIARLRRPWLPKPDWVFASETLRARCGETGEVQLSPIDLDRFSSRRDAGGSGPNDLVVGRLSRDVPEKHHPDDPALYRALAARGIRVRLMGATVLRDALAGVPGLELLAEGAEPAEDFLRTLDVFVYRTGTAWFESFGRVVFEAMASGLPVVVHRRGGYLDHLDPGTNAFVFESNAEAIGAVERLRASPALREAIGRAARQRVESLYGSHYVEGLRAFYFGARPPSGPAGAPPDPPVARSVPARITVFFGADDSFAGPLLVALESLLAGNAAHRFAVHVATTGLNAAHRRRLADVAAHHGAEAWLHSVSGDMIAGLPTSERISTASYCRLLMPRLLPPELDRALYLDCDLVVTGDIGPLWRTELGEALVAAVADPGADRARRSALGLPPEHRYVNSGVLLANLAAWRREGLAEQAVGFLRRFPHRVQYHDQDALNACLRGRVRYLSCVWNYMPYLSGTREHEEHARIERGELEPAIVHFAGTRKPWIERLADRWGEQYERFARTHDKGALPIAMPRVASAVSKPTCRRFCVVTGGRSGSTSLMNALQAHGDIALPNKDLWCPGSELPHRVNQSTYLDHYGRRVGRTLRSELELIESFYACHREAAFAGFKLFPTRLAEFAEFARRADVRFIAIVRRDLPATIASFMAARASGRWRRTGDAQGWRWSFDRGTQGARVAGKLRELVGDLRGIRALDRPILLTYEACCSGPAWANAELDAFFERPIRFPDPVPPIDPASYVEHWQAFREYVLAETDRLDPELVPWLSRL